MRSQFALVMVASLHWGGCEKSGPSPGTVLEGKPAPATTPERTSETAKPAPPLNEDRILKEEDMPQLNEAALNSDNPKEAMKMGQAYAASDRPEDHVVLLKYLKDREFYARLDDAEAYQGWQQRLRLATIMQVLRTNPAKAAQDTLVALCDSKEFTAHVLRNGLLVLALVSVRPSPPKVIEFWRKNAAPGEVQQHVVPDALADNGSEPAIALLEELFLGPQPDDQKRVWIQDAVIRHRFELPMIRAAERLVQKLPTGLAVSLVEIYFVYRPDKWYLECTPPKPQPYEQADKRSRQHLLNLATFALDKLPLSGDPELKAKVEATKELLEKEKRETGGWQ